LIVEDVRIIPKDATIGDQRAESFIKYYDVQVFVFNNWWSIDKEPEHSMDLQKAINMRDKFISIIKGTA